MAIIPVGAEEGGNFGVRAGYIDPRPVPMLYNKSSIIFLYYTYISFNKFIEKFS